MANEDFTTYTEVDTGNYITETASTITMLLMTYGNACYLYKDYGASHFAGNFRLNIDLNLTAYGAGSGANNSCLSVLSDFLGTEEANRVGNKNQIGIAFGDYASGYPILLEEVNGGNNYYAQAYSPASTATTYYLQIFRDTAVGANGTIYLYVYGSSSDRTNGVNLLGSSSIALQANISYRYAMGVQNYASTGGGTALSGTIANWDLAATAPPTGPANLKSLDGNLKANIKSISGNLIANVKKFDGNA